LARIERLLVILLAAFVLFAACGSLMLPATSSKVRSNMAPEPLFIPSTYSLNEGTEEMELFDISDYFTDDNQESWELEYSIVNFTHPEHVYCSTLSYRFLSVDATIDSNWNGKFQVTVMAMDDGGLSSTSNVFNISVIPVNDPPIITNEPPLTCLEDDAYSFRLNATDPDGDDLNWEIGGNATWLFLGYDTGILSGFPQNEDAGRYKVYVNVSDNSGAKDGVIFWISVKNVNDAPVLLDPPESVVRNEDETFYIDMYSWFQDVDSYPLDFDVSNEKNLSLTFHSNGTAEFVPAKDWYGSEELTFTANDSSLNVSVTVNTVIASLEDAPTDLKIELSEFQYLEGGKQPAWGYATDGDLQYYDNHNYSFSSNSSGHIGYGEWVNLSLKAGLHTVTLTVKDRSGLTGTAFVKINVLPPPNIPGPEINDTDDENNTNDDIVEDVPFYYTDNFYFLVAGIIIFLVITLVVVTVIRSRGKPKPEKKEPEMVDAEITTDDVFKEKEDGETAMPDEAATPEAFQAPPEPEIPEYVPPGLDDVELDEDHIMEVWEEGTMMALPPSKMFEAEFEDMGSMDEVFIFNQMGEVLYHFSYQDSGVQDPDMLASILTVLQGAITGGGFAWKESAMKELRVGKMGVFVVLGKYLGAVAVCSAGEAGVFGKAVNRFLHEVETVNLDLLEDEEEPPSSLIGVDDCILKLVHRGY